MGVGGWQEVREASRDLFTLILRVFLGFCQGSLGPQTRVAFITEILLPAQEAPLKSCLGIAIAHVTRLKQDTVP